MEKIIIIFYIFALAGCATFTHQNQKQAKLDQQQNHPQRKQITVGYSFDAERHYGWCFMVLRQGIGIYVDSRTNARGHSIDENGYYVSLTLEESEKWNTYIKTETHKAQYTIGLTYPLMRWLYGYISVGRDLEQKYYNYYDSYYDNMVLFNNGSYWLGGSRKVKTVGQSGVILYATPFFLKIGASFNPVEYQIGAGIKIY